MSYLVIARKFRPLTFSEVCGQEHVTRTLANAIRRDRIGHAYLFAGPRGVGKTSIARIFAKALNCEKGPTPEPCAKCTNCVEIAQGTNLAVREIDGASHNSVDNVRDLIESFRGLPPPGSRYKIYIIDEVHMFSTAAFNALLKSLEEPPPNTVFILATTEAHKIPETVISRCQRHDFRSINHAEIEQRLVEICKAEAIAAEKEVLRMVARLSEGSMRDAQSLLERVNAFCDGRITVQEASIVLGSVARNVLFTLSQAIFAHDASRAIEVIADVFSRGVDPGLFLREFAAHFRELLLARFGGEKALKELGVAEEDRIELLRQSGSASEQDIQDLGQLAREGCDMALRSSHPRHAIEALVVRMATREPVQAIAQLIASISRGGLTTSSVSASSPKALPVPQRAPAAKEAAVTTSAIAETSAKENAAPQQMLEWGDFVRKVTEGGSRIVAEHLKRLSVRKFALSEKDGGGIFEASGPDFSIASLQQADNKKKLEAALQQFTGAKRWTISLAAGGSTARAEVGSLLQQEEERKAKSRQEKTQDISNHPSIKSLQKVFPGSKIENIKIKEE